MSELLDLLRKDIRAAGENEVADMVGAPASYDDLAEAREALIEAISVALTASERESLLSIKAAKPRWELMDLPGIVTLPEIQWQLANIEKMSSGKTPRRVRATAVGLGQVTNGDRNASGSSVFVVAVAASSLNTRSVSRVVGSRQSLPPVSWRRFRA